MLLDISPDRSGRSVNFVHFDEVGLDIILADRCPSHPVHEGRSPLFAKSVVFGLDVKIRPLRRVERIGSAPLPASEPILLAKAVQLLRN